MTDFTDELIAAGLGLFGLGVLAAVLEHRAARRDAAAAAEQDRPQSPSPASVINDSEWLHGEWRRGLGLDPELPGEVIGTVPSFTSNHRVAYVPQLADPGHPTAAELNQGVDLSNVISGVDFGWDDRQSH